MPLPRYQPLRKRPKTGSPGIEDLDDYCLSKIIGFALELSSRRNDGSRVGDNGRTERNLSLVSKRWYFLTQCQVVTYGVHRINLDKISRVALPNRLKYGSVTKKPRTLMQSSISNTTTTTSSIASLRKPPSNATNDSLELFASIRNKLLKYKHIQIDGFLTCNEFKKLIIAIDAARVEKLDLRVKIEKDGTQIKDFSALPKQLRHLERLTLFWFNDIKNDYSNGLTWTIYERALRLKTLEIHLNDEIGYSFDTNIDQSKGNAIEGMASKYLSRPLGQAAGHECLEKLVFKRNSPIEPASDCSFTTLCRTILSREDSVQQVETNDQMLIEYLIKSSERLCTTHELKSLKFLTPLRSVDLLSQLLSSKSLGKNLLSIVIDNVDQIETVRHLMEDFKSSRHPCATCHLNIHLKDQKFSDFEDKIKNLTHLCRSAIVTIYITVQQRVSIDCCHLMWSVGRTFQSSDKTGRCLFKINLQNAPKQQSGSSSNSEITIPFGSFTQYRINNDREDLARHREIIKSMKKECYHMFVKSVRDNIAI